ncbi:uncharacterized protein LOC131216399 [Anopheles bellator]|uniref:uncharacterized protein LOC131216399 n=1 Tax=Anopheles bellator TaxID=139047 RepID=UPI002647A44E|nr:uncharacterized protein LOC131216399 [Anopheles bellator]
MESFKSLNWSRNTPIPVALLHEHFSVDYSLFPDDIFNLHIDEIDPIHRIENTFNDPICAIEMPIDPRTGKTVTQLTVDATAPMAFFDAFPSGSSLPHEAHQHCLGVLHQINMRLLGPAKNSRNYKRYTKLMTALESERELFNNFVRNHFVTNLLWRLKAIPPELNALVVDLWRYKVDRWQRQQANEVGAQYHLKAAIAYIGYTTDHNDPVELAPVGEDALETGAVRCLRYEDVVRSATLLRSQRVLEQFRDESCKLIDRRRADDRLTVETILEHQPDVSIVLSASAFGLLLNESRVRGEQWTIPFRIATVAGRRVFLVESKLPPLKLSTYDRNAKGHRMLVKSYIKFLQTDQTVADGASFPKSLPSEEQPFRAVPFDEYMQRMASKMSTKGSALRENRFYQLWKLKEKQDEHFLLIAFRQDCYESLRKLRLFMNISVKLEHQPEFGAEQMTKVELLREWTRQLLRPNSKTLRLRINTLNHTVISHHYLELRDIEEELLRLYGINPHHLITSVWCTLRLIQNFPPGEYILQRDDYSAQGLSVYARADSKPAENGIVIDLAKRMAAIDYDIPPLEQYEWIPIDKCFITQLHRENMLLPCTFPHWRRARQLESRKKHKVRAKLPNPVVRKKSGKTSAAKALRKAKRKVVKQKQREQLMMQENLQKSLDQYAPYEGPSKGAQQPVERTVPAKSATNEAVPSLKDTASTQSIDYGAYLQQVAKYGDQ